MKGDPKLSIVLTIVDGGPYVRDFLLAVRRMTDAPPLEVIVPFDASAAPGLTFREEFPEVAFLDLGTITPHHPITSEAGQHELYDRRRAAGLAAATGDIVAILEDRGHPQPDWARTVIRLHAETPYGVIGGAIAGREPVSLLNRAIYVTDFGRYCPPFESGPADWVSDVNISYSRRILEETRHLWKDRYQEPVVHWFLMGRGEKLLLSNEMVVSHKRPPASLAQILPERFHWGRLFGHIRAKEYPPAKRLLYILGSPLIPPLLWLRHFRMQAAKGRGGRYLAALPYVMILTVFWTAGEVWGTITKRP